MVSHTVTYILPYNKLGLCGINRDEQSMKLLLPIILVLPCDDDEKAEPGRSKRGKNTFYGKYVYQKYKYSITNLFIGESLWQTDESFQQLWGE